MTEGQRKPVWWQSLPGMLTAGAAFLAALTGMLTGLKELGLFERDAPAPTEVAASADTVIAPDSAAPDSSPIKVGPPPARDTASSTVVPVRPPPSTRPVTPARVESTPPAPAPTEHTAAAVPAVLPEGAQILLAASARLCSAALDEGDRLEAVVLAPVALGDSVVLPAGAVAVLRARRVNAPTFLRLRLDSLVSGGRAIPVPRSDVRARLASGGAQEGRGACVPRGGRITVTLRQDLPLGAR